MHEERNTKFAHSGEDGALRSLKPNDDFLQATYVRTSCTQVCGHGRFRGKSCAKTVLVNKYPEHNPERNLKAYILINDQSNRLIARSEFFDYFGENTQEIEYMLSSCPGHISTIGRQTSWYVIESLDGGTSLPLPTLIECNRIPNMREEIPTLQVARYH